MTQRKKLIEVALPLEAINKESAREKSIHHGHPSTLHIWWSRKPLSTCRAVLFASLVDDPSGHPELFPTEEAQENERRRLFHIIEELVKWENSNDERILEQARSEIVRYSNGNLPTLLDPFCGSGSIPFEGLHLGLETYASDINPVAILITKALLEIPPKFAGKPPVNPETRKKSISSDVWRGAQGLAADVRYYGQWMRDEAERRIGQLYPKVRLPEDQGGVEVKAAAWIWVRTVKCPNPACGIMMPLSSKFWLSTKKDRKAWLESIVDRTTKQVRFDVKLGEGSPPEGTVNRRGATCIGCNSPVTFEHIRAEGKAQQMSVQLAAIAAYGKKGRIYLPSSEEQEMIAAQAEPNNVPDTDLPEQALGFRVQLYGIKKHHSLFTPRQLSALTVFSDLIKEVWERVRNDAVEAGFDCDYKPLEDGGMGAAAYADAVTTYLGFALDRFADYWSSLNSWQPASETVSHTFTRQTLSMIWDFVEANPFSDKAGSFKSLFDFTVQYIHLLPTKPGVVCRQLDAVTINGVAKNLLICTDPPYYDNIGYADLSDFFYIWLRRSLFKTYPEIFSTMLVPKEQELVANPGRFGGDKEKAKQFFEEGLSRFFARMREVQHPDYPLTLFYAFKQSEADGSDRGNSHSPSSIASTGWETMLEGLVRAGFTINGTWPIRTEMEHRLRGIGSNALASSIVLVCRPRPSDASPTTRKELLNALRKELPSALKRLQQGNIAPVDLTQASIGPGISIYSRYSKVLELDGNPMPVRTVLALINQILDEYMSEQESEFDPDTRWALAWFEQFAFDEGSFGVAETLSKAKNTSINGMIEAGILSARAGKVRLLQRDELPTDWDPTTDRRLTVWEIVQHLVRAHDQKGDIGAAALLSKTGTMAEAVRDLAYRLYLICDRKKLAQEATIYNGLVIAWPEIDRLSRSFGTAPQQEKLFN